jgi:hypothetical protein
MYCCFDLVLGLKKTRMEGDCWILLVHVARKRMIWQGSDGLSHGDENAGVMKREDMMTSVPLHRWAIDHSDEPLSWVWSWSWSGDKHGKQKVMLLQSEDWPSAHQERGVYLWSPASSGCGRCIARMARGQSIHKRPYNTHIVLILRLTVPWWRTTKTGIRRRRMLDIRMNLSSDTLGLSSVFLISPTYGRSSTVT